VLLADFVENTRQSRPALLCGKFGRPTFILSSCGRIEVAHTTNGVELRAYGIVRHRPKPDGDGVEEPELDVRPPVVVSKEG